MSIVISGGGMSGAILALGLDNLTKGKIKINIIEAQELGSLKYWENRTRVLALDKESKYKLVDIGIWKNLSSCATAIKQIEVSDQRYYIGNVKISASDYQCSTLGYVVGLNEIRVKLLKLLKQSSNIRLYSPAVLKYIECKKDNNIVILDDGTQIISKLVVSADGSYSSSAFQCGIRWFHSDYYQIAVIANIVTAIPHYGRAFERFTKYGSLAFLPISGDRSALIWCLPSKFKQEISSWNVSRFCQELQHLFGWPLGRIIDVSTRYFYSLCLRVADRHIAHRLALVGDAAQTVHPIVAQGFNLGLRDVLTLINVLVEAIEQNEDIGNYYILKRYQQQRKIDQAKIIGVTDGLVNLFANKCLPLVIIRNLGLLAMTYSPFLRRNLIKLIIGRIIW